MALRNVDNRHRRLLLIGLTVARREQRTDPCGYLDRIVSPRLSIVSVRGTHLAHEKQA